MEKVDLQKFTRNEIRFLESGHYRDVYQYGPYVVKFLHNTIEKKLGPFTFTYRTEDYVRKRFGIEDLNEHERQNYRRLQKEIPEFEENFARVLDVRPFQGRSVSIGKLVTNMDGSIAPRLLEHGKVRDSQFWTQMHSIEQALLDRKIPYLDASAYNTVVKVTDAGRIPVFVDHKRVGWQMYPYQLLLRFQWGSERKIRRKFARMREQFQMR